jgi:hAT family C-terminal dimerisation region
MAAELGTCTHPAVSILLRIFATLPVTAATCERYFSLQYTKNNQKLNAPKMGEERLNRLARVSTLTQT